MDVTEFLNHVLARPDVWGLVAATLLMGFGLYLKHRASEKPPPPEPVNTRVKIETVASRMDEIDSRLARVEDDIEHLPKREEFHQMEIGMVRLQERMIGIEQTTKSTGRAVGRIEDFMISKKGK